MEQECKFKWRRKSSSEYIMEKAEGFKVKSDNTGLDSWSGETVEKESIAVDEEDVKYFERGDFVKLKKGEYSVRQRNRCMTDDYPCPPDTSDDELAKTPPSPETIDPLPLYIPMRVTSTAGSTKMKGNERQGLGTESDPLKIGDVKNPSAKKMRIVHISDTHMKHDNFLLDIPHGDVLVHSGDFANCHESKGKHPKEAFLQDVRNINEFFSKLPHKSKIFVAGNHESSFNPYSTFRSTIQSQLKDIIYLQDSGVRIDGVLFYGSPWNRSTRMGFSMKDIKPVWRKIPNDTDVLVTHMPPLSILDLAYSKKLVAKKLEAAELGERCLVCKEKPHVDRRHWGCPHLRNCVLHYVKPLAHLFGHVHNENGVKFYRDVLFSNAAMEMCPRANVIDLYYIPRSDSDDCAKPLIVESQMQTSSSTILHSQPSKFRQAQASSTFLQSYPLELHRPAAVTSYGSESSSNFPSSQSGALYHSSSSNFAEEPYDFFDGLLPSSSTQEEKKRKPKSRGIVTGLKKKIHGLVRREDRDGEGADIDDGLGDRESYSKESHRKKVSRDAEKSEMEICQEISKRDQVQKIRAMDVSD